MTKPPGSSVDKIMKRFGVGPETTLREVISHIELNGEGAAVVVDSDRRFMGIITDGDVRRAILAKLNFDQSVRDFLEHKTGPGPKAPLTAPVGTPHNKLVEMMDENKVRHLPLLDKNGRIAGLSLLSDLERRDRELPVRGVVMAGGFGRRLGPLTTSTPKPLLRVGKKPVMERIVEQLRDSGIINISVTTHFQADMIKKHFGDGSDLGVNIDYTHEEEPLGTAGALSMLAGTGEPLLVINGDIRTEVDFKAMLSFHREHSSVLTVGVRKYDLPPLPFGVIEAEGSRVISLVEKPSLSVFINAGIYLLEPSVVKNIPQNKKFDMTDVIDDLLKEGKTVTSFPIHEYWMDVGQQKDLLEAQKNADPEKFE